MDLLMIDTVILCGLSEPHGNGQPIHDLRSVHADAPPPDEQWAWINSTLHSSTADWLIVSGHYPVWSIAEHGKLTSARASVCALRRRRI